MGIPNELSSDVAAAILARKDDQVSADTNALLEIVRNFHSALRELANEERRRRVSTLQSVSGKAFNASQAPLP